MKNGFSKNTKVVEYSGWETFKAFLKGTPTASLSIHDFYSVDSPWDNGVLGFVLMGSNNALIYDKGIILGRKNNPSMIDLMNVSTHELGYAIFSFQHSETGIMHWSYPTGQGFNYLKGFNSAQKMKIRNSIWGQ